MAPYLVIMFFFGLSAGTIGKIKGSSFFIWFMIGFAVYWPSWVMCSVPLPGLDRYMPTRPPHLL